MRKIPWTGIALALAFSVGVAQAEPRQVGQDMKGAGHDTADAGKTVGHDTAHVTKKGYHKTKHYTKKGYHKTVNGTKTGYDKTKDGTENLGDKIAGKPATH